MDDRQLVKEKERLKGLEKKVAELGVKQNQVQARLDGEHDLIRKGAAQRATLLARLLDADGEASRRMHKELDGIESAIKASERLCEAYQHQLKQIASEFDDAVRERDKVGQIVGQEVNAREFAAWAADIDREIKAAAGALASARLALAALSIDCATGLARFGAAAGSGLGEKIDKFIHQQSNPESLLNFKLAIPFFRGDLRAMVYPMVEKG